MKNFIFDLNNKKTSDNIYTFRAKEPNYSKMLDDLISADIKEKNYFLYTTPKNTTKMSDIEAFLDAKNFLANYKKTKLPYTYNTVYYFGDTPVIFFEDSIQIGFDLYFYNDFNKDDILQLLPKQTKKTIIDIYTNGLKISIKL